MKDSTAVDSRNKEIGVNYYFVTGGKYQNMPTVEENLRYWTNYDWNRQGEEWSECWGGAEWEWWVTIFPRIRSFLSCETILEIACGTGRWTHYLKEYCQHLIALDIVEECIEACKVRFASCKHITYYVNDGKSLAMIPDNSLDFVFSFDSLIHAQADVIEAYLLQLAKKMRPNGFGFIHHSNIGQYLDPSTGKLHVENICRRGEDMTARKFQEYCEKAGLQCISQEVINWWERDVLNDCFSLFAPKGFHQFRSNHVIENPNFGAEIARSFAISELYGSTNIIVDTKTTSRNSLNTVDEIFLNMPAVFDPEKAVGINATIQFNLTGDGGGTWSVVIANNKCNVISGATAAPDLTITMVASDYVAMVHGDLDPVTAFVQGRLKSQGDIQLGLKLQSMFSY